MAINRRQFLIGAGGLAAVATTMGLGACALGAGDADLFAAAAGTGYYAQSSVGELVLGSLPADAVPAP